MPAEYLGGHTSRVRATIAERRLGESTIRRGERRLLIDDSQSVHAHQLVRIGCRGSELLRCEASQPAEYPQAVRALLGCGALPVDHSPNGCDDLVAAAVHELIHRHQSNCDVRTREVGDQLVGAGARPVSARCASGRADARARVHDSPDPAAPTIASGIIERELVVADDRVVEIRDVQCAVRSQLDVDRTKVRVGAHHEVLELDRLGRAAVPRAAGSG